jgi:hypothetical protein
LISDEDEAGSSSRANGRDGQGNGSRDKGKKKTTKRTLTPPPTLSEAKVKEIETAVK